MAKTKVPPHPSLGKNIAELMKAMEGLASQPALAKKAGLAQSTVGRIIRGEVSPSTDNLRKIADAFGVSVSKLLFDTDDFLTELRGGTVHLDGSPSPIAGVAHNMSLLRPTVSLPKMTWEALMTTELIQPFELEVVDDALSPEIFRGCVAILNPQRPPEPAWPVLVRDQHGNHYLRDYEEGPAGSWRAVARSRGYTPLDSEAHGLEVVAAMEGYKRPPPKLQRAEVALSRA